MNPLPWLRYCVLAMRTTRLRAADVEAKLRQFHGNMAAVGRALGFACSTIKRFVDKRPKLLALVIDERETMKDHAESRLYDAVLRGEMWAIRLFLTTQAKDRGYSLRSEHKYAGEGCVKLTRQRVIEEVTEPAGAA